MPVSLNEGKEWIQSIVKKLVTQCQFNSILDVGVGAGTYSNLLRSSLPQMEFIGVEIWEPYISQYDLTNKYHHIIKEDIRKYTPEKQYAFTFLGDVLEHMTKEEAIDVYQKLLHNSEFVIISIPIVRCPQGPYAGNPYETHVKEDWTHQEVLSTFSNLLFSYTAHQIGVYLGVNPHYHSAEEVKNLLTQQ
ncbi:class I SAM-dependent methyltransferase [Bacillus sp. UNC438CL73TsuS30]|uniref:class I SAM-dependent methyltransferase n=1 Tax=Bacillus sp. UNC438CL73TsuS30 TaxID=1340434 RepID=UPI00047869AE|nr:class I SAM-dependent methyltransferase [Bacillus sp. UNC438CL73TsuS30]